MRYYVRRMSAQSVFTLLSGLFLTYALYRLIPGSPLKAIMADLIAQQSWSGTVDTEQVAEMAEQMTGINPDEPIIVGFFQLRQWDRVAGDFWDLDPLPGPGVRHPLPGDAVVHLPQRLRHHAGFTASILVGVLMAWHEGSKLDSGLTVLVLSVNAIPYYVGAIVFLSVLAFQWGLFPTGGRRPRAVEPGFNLAFMEESSTTGVTDPVDVPPRVRCGVARDAGQHRPHRRLRLSPFGAPCGGEHQPNPDPVPDTERDTAVVHWSRGRHRRAVCLERDHRTDIPVPGRRLVPVESATNQDHPLVMGSFIFFGTVTVLGILIADLTYGLIDPRAESGSTRDTF